MKSWQHLTLQFVLTVLQGASALELPVKPQWKAFIALVLAAAQGALGQIMIQFNPDGTSAKLAYTPTAAPAKPS